MIRRSSTKRCNSLCHALLDVEFRRFVPEVGDLFCGPRFLGPVRSARFSIAENSVRAGCGSS